MGNKVVCKWKKIDVFYRLVIVAMVEHLIVILYAFFAIIVPEVHSFTVDIWFWLFIISMFLVYVSFCFCLISRK